MFFAENQLNTLNLYKDYFPQSSALIKGSSRTCIRVKRTLEALVELLLICDLVNVGLVVGPGHVECWFFLGPCSMLLGKQSWPCAVVGCFYRALLVGSHL